MDDLSEKEQLDLMRAGWSENGRYVIGGVVLVVVIALYLPIFSMSGTVTI